MSTVNGVPESKWLSTCPKEPGAIVSVVLTPIQVEALDNFRGERSRAEAIRDLIMSLRTQTDGGSSEAS